MSSRLVLKEHSLYWYLLEKDNKDGLPQALSWGKKRFLVAETVNGTAYVLLYRIKTKATLRLTRRIVLRSIEIGTFKPAKIKEKGGKVIWLA